VKVVIIDIRNSREQTQKVMEGVPVKALVLLDDRGLGRDVFEVKGTPTTLIVDGDGRAVFRHVGYAEYMDDMLSNEIEALLERSRPL
jgi:hypothetical protein